MKKADVFFEEAWDELLVMYKEDWEKNLVKYRKHGKKALTYLPEHFYSEGDVEAVLSCMLRNKLRNETHYNSEYIVRNQLRIGKDDYEGFSLSDKIIKMRRFIKKAKLGKETFVPDIVIDRFSEADEGSFLLFAELTYEPGFNQRYNKGIPGRIKELKRKLNEEAETLTAAIDAEVLKSGYVCAISDDLVSIEGAFEIIEELEDKYEDVGVYFLYDGMTLVDKLEIIDRKK